MAISVKQKPIKQKVEGKQDAITTFELSFMLLFAILKDALDVGLILAFGLGLILNRVTSLLIAAIFWLWCLYRLHRFPTKRFVGSFLGELIPLLGGLPFWTAFVISIWIKKYLPIKIRRTTKV